MEKEDIDVIVTLQNNMNEMYNIIEELNIKLKSFENIIITQEKYINYLENENKRLKDMYEVCGQKK
jgi:cellulose synthase/poly-beta-1,6-N-acetylglucosamine synthase-like glycosyltransferase